MPSLGKGDRAGEKKKLRRSDIIPKVFYAADLITLLSDGNKRTIGGALGMQAKAAAP